MIKIERASPAGVFLRPRVATEAGQISDQAQISSGTSPISLPLYFGFESCSRFRVRVEIP